MKRFVISLLLLCNVTADAIIQKTDQKIFITSIPKSGTNLIMKLISALTNKSYDTNSQNFLMVHSNQSMNFKSKKFFVTHAIASEQNIASIGQSSFKGIFILRDPRDQVVSLANYIYKLPSEWPILCAIPFSELLTRLITDISCIQNNKLWAMNELLSYHSIASFYYAYLDWIPQPFMYTTYFEKLIGPNGGGSPKEQIAEIKNISNHVGIELEAEEAQEIANSLFGGTGTFHEGKIGSWKKYFTQNHIDLFKEVAGQLLIDLGYEMDLNW